MKNQEFITLNHIILHLFPGALNSYNIQILRAFLIAQLVKNPPATQETLVRSLGWDDHLKGKATHSSIPWRILENSMDCIVHGVAKSRT